MPSRASAPRSHLGCKECKRRHVKCDETLPACRRCVRNNRKCSLSEIFETSPDSFVIVSQRAPLTSIISNINSPTNLTQSRRASTLQTGASSSPQASPASTAPSTRNPTELSPSTSAPGLDLVNGQGDSFLLDHFINATAETLNDRPGVQRIFRVTAPKLATTRPYLLYSMLTLAGQHVLTMRSVTAHKDLESIAIRNRVLDCQQRSLSMFKSEMDPELLTGEDCVATLLAASFILMSSMADYTLAHDNHWYEEDCPTALEKAVEIFRLLAGLGHFGYNLFLRWPLVANTGLEAIVEYPATVASTSIMLAPDLEAGLQKLELLCASKQLSSDVQAFYASALAGLRSTFGVTSQNPQDIGHHFCWIQGKNALTLAELAAQGLSEALLIIAFWAAGMAQGHEPWWQRGLSQGVVKQIEKAIPASVQSYLEWPLKICAKNSAADDTRDAVVDNDSRTEA